MIYFSADTHFNGKIILKRSLRPFKRIEEHDKYILRLWNEQIHHNDIIYHLGDWLNYTYRDTNSWTKAMSYVKKIKCPVILVIGNNEQRLINDKFDGDFGDFRRYAISCGFKDVVTEEYLAIKGQKYYLNHFPVNHKDGYINLFGHVHAIGGIFKPYGLNVGCDISHFRLISENNLEYWLQQKRDFWDDDPDILDR